MSVRAQILQFLRDPKGFAGDAADESVWLDGLTFARASIAAHHDYNLRPAQVTAWEGLASTRAGLVLGPPGTGKTHLLSWLILGYIFARREAGLPCRVLVSAFTLNAIGNLLEAIVKRRDEHWADGPTLRFFGSAPSNGLPAGVEHRARLDGRNATDAINELISDEIVVVGASIWSLYRLLQNGAAPNADGLTGELFDLVCIDEASQMVLGHGLMALGGLKPGGRVVVAGDDRQLPPVRASREVSLDDRQLGGSLYGFLKSAGVPEFALNETFRLNGPLAVFPERKFYPGSYHSAVETNQLRLKVDWKDGLQDWVQIALDPQWPICVLLHDGPPSATSNVLEGELAVKLAHMLVDRLPAGRSLDGSPATDLWTNQIAIVSPHRAQNSLIKGMLSGALRQGAFVETVDRIQGKERDTIILSYCVADTEFALAEGDFIFAPERLNVAITRARTKLIALISRRLLDAVPADQDVMDKAELLREFVFSCSRAGDIQYRTRDGHDVSIQVRIRGFGGDQPLTEIKPTQCLEETTRSELSPSLQNVLSAVVSTALGNPRGEASLGRLQQVLARGPDLLADLADLHGLGCVSLRYKTGRFGSYWTVRPLDPRRHVFNVDKATVLLRLEEVIAQVRRGSFPPRYDEVRDRFAWLSRDGQDQLRIVVEQLKDQGLVQLGTWGAHLTIDWIEQDEASTASENDGSAAGKVEVSDDDFEVLNDLERLEAASINFGIFEAWTSAALLADKTGRNRQAVTTSLARLSTAGWVMLAEEGRVRSRMAELAREIRYVKQRFAREDADQRPYLVRSLKIELRDRDKPERRTPLESTFERLAGKLSHYPHHAAALNGLAGALTKLWGDGATIAGFQARGLEVLTRAWLDEGPDTFVVAADTGSGKTEAAGLPLIAAAAADRLKGIRGVRAVLAYPRIRLAANQAQRLTRYLAALAREPGMPTVTLGLQVGQVPESFDTLNERERAAGWTSAGEGQFTFPFFACPAEDCGGELLLQHGKEDQAADRLTCTQCSWHYNGWIGSKAKLRENPPDLFLPTTDSLHQWLHDVRYGRLFGDDPAFAPPRAILADEIHLYSHIHGAQVGLALRRLAARAEINAGGHRSVLAIGMSATLGEPAVAWGRLIGRETIVAIQPEPQEKIRSPRGREYFYFVQPEVESRGQDIAGASTTIQTLMCLAHGMRRRTGREGGFRSLVFLDSIDKVRRLHAAFSDAEESKRLARYRTRFYVDESTGDPRDGCCGEPSGCDAFRNGECWWFAATDRQQHGAQGYRRPGQTLKVAEQPVSSVATGRIEALIKDSDVVFSTSSLEVGYDDPDITLVYQHYAPQNLASFIQRKGRGGRGTDDRPITGVTLSIYSSRDSWWFRQPHEMIEPVGFESPLNPDNHFVRRGQLLATILDGFAWHQRRSGQFVRPASPSQAAFAAAKHIVCRIFGEEPWREFENCTSLEALWERAISRAIEVPASLRDARSTIDWIPNLLFETINLPQLLVETGLSDEPRREDIALALTTATPGNATRRFDQVAVLWRPPANGYAPWLAAADYENGQRSKPFGDDANLLLARLPVNARPLLGGLSPEVFRPRTLKLETVGRMHGIGWQSDWIVTDDATPTCQQDTNGGQNRRAVQHDSRASLRGFPIIKANPERARSLILSDLDPWVENTECFVGNSLGGKETGLAMARVYWGADAEVRLAGPREEPVTFSQVFTDYGKQRPMLHGYHVQTEGIRFRLNSKRLDDLIMQESARLEQDEPLCRWHAGQMLRFLVESGAQAAGVNGYDARRGAELMVSAAGDAHLRKRIARLLRLWSRADLESLFEDTRATLLSQHPLLSQRRVIRVAESLSDLRFQRIFSDAVAATGDASRFRVYLKSVAIHSIASRLRESFIQVGRADERQVIMHVELPLQFDDESDGVVTLCEAGAFGDGTTRTFINRLEEAVEHWRNGFMSQCPNAREDAAVKRFFDMTSHHEGWRTLDPNDPAALRQVQEALGLGAEASIPASLLRILYGTETIGIERFALYDLAASVRRVDDALALRLKREPTAWELTSAVVESARLSPASIEGRILRAYAGLDDASQEESLSPEARLADQTFRIHARLCVDGCQACVHQPSDMMSETLVEASTSRRLLCEFIGN
jgi:hypothetical protein